MKRPDPKHNQRGEAGLLYLRLKLRPHERTQIVKRATERGLTVSQHVTAILRGRGE